MVDFNPVSTPGVSPTTPDNWLGWSRPGQTPRPDMSGEIIGKTVGKAIEGAGEIAGGQVKAYASSGASDILENETRLVEQGLLEATGARGEAPTPPDVSKVGSTVETLQSSKANGAISPTYYRGTLLKFQKETRDQFPMFKRQIDEGIREATGVAHTANEYYESALKDLNSFLTGKDEYMKSTQGETRQNTGLTDENGITSAEALRRSRGQSASGITWTADQLADYNARVQSRDAKNKSTLLELNTKKAIDADVKEQAMATAHQRGYDAVNELTMGVSEKLGLKTEGDIIDRMNNPHSPQEATQMAEAFAPLIPKAEAEIEKRLMEPPKTKDGKPIINPRTGRPWESLGQLVGPEGVDQVRKSTTAKLQAIKRFIEDNSTGPLTHFARVNTAAATAMRSDVLRSEAGNAILMGDALKDAPEFLQKFVQSRLSKGFIPVLNGSLDPLLLKSYFPDAATLSKADPKAKLSSLEKDVKTVSDEFKTSEPVKTLVDDIPRVMSDPSTPDAVKIAKMRYVIGNLGDSSMVNRSWVLRAWDQDGRPQALKTMFGTDTIAAVKALDDKYSGLNLFGQMKSAAMIHVRDMIGQEVNELAEDQSTDNYKVGYTSEGNVHRFEVEPKNPNVVGAGSSLSPLNTVRKRVEKINTGLSIMSDIAKHDSSDPDVFILTALRDFHYFPGGATFPERMAKQVKTIYGDENAKYKSTLDALKEKMTGKK